MHGSPCQDFSFAGLGRGGDEGSGTRSSLMYESLRIIDKLKPKYVIWENVKAVLSKKHKHNFDKYQEVMEHMGYTNYYQVLNAKDYGVPQNRERVFTVSIRHDIPHDFIFPEAMPLEKRIKDILEPAVDEKYYLSDEKIKRMKMTNFVKSSFDNPQCVKVGDLDIKGHDSTKRVYSSNGISPTLTTMGGGNREPKTVVMRGRNTDNSSDRTVRLPTEQRLEVNNKGVSNTFTSVQKDNLVCEPTIVGSTQKHATVNHDGVCPTLTRVMGDGGGQIPMHNYDYRVRKLTPKECWRLMGFDDEDYKKASKLNSNTQLYKQAGNSICVPVLEAILHKLFAI